MASPQWLQTLAKIAPSIAAAASGPFAGLVGPAVAAALGLVVHTDDPTAAKVDPLQQLQTQITAGTLTADQILALKKADQDFALDMAQKNIDIDKLYLEDVQSARAREVAVKDNTPRILAFFMIGGFFATTFALLICVIVWPERVNAIQSAAWGLLNLIVGYLAREAMAATNYYYGTTQGNEASTSNDAIAMIQKGAQQK